MKRIIKSLTLVALFASYCIPSWAQAPTTEGQDFWVTFLRAGDANSGASGHGDPQELKLTISARDSCIVTIQQEGVDDIVLSVGDNSSTQIGSSTTTAIDINGRARKLTQNSCYSYDNEKKTKTAAHVTATKDISLFAGNYRDKSFDAANVLPTQALLDDYLVQTYPPSDHENKPHGSHFAIVAVEDGETTVDYNLTAKTNGGNIGAQSVTLKKGEVYYIWTGKNAGDEADLSGTTIKARDKKKIAVFQGCVHTNIPKGVRDRDHIFSQAMPTAYWGTEFGITASRKHRRDIVAVMAITDGTQVFINDEDGDPELVYTFDFSRDEKQYWTFEIGESLAYCADGNRSDFSGKLPTPLVVDSSCYLTTSCPAGVHLFMVSNRYDNVVPEVDDDTLVSDPAMLWISPIEQVIKEINFSTYSTAQDSLHFMNIVTTTDNAASMKWNGQGIEQYFHPMRGNSDYSFARILIQDHHLAQDKIVNHNLKGRQGFLAHVYGYGQRESYAYSCGSSTVHRSISFDGMQVDIGGNDSVKLCLNDTIEIRLNLGNNDYQNVSWDFGDGVHSDPNKPNQDVVYHAYKSAGWYDLEVTASYVDQCTGIPFDESFAVRIKVKDDPIIINRIAYEEDGYTGKDIDTTIYDCDSIVYVHHEIIRTCLGLQIENQPDSQQVCSGEDLVIPFSYQRGGKYGKAYLCRVEHTPGIEPGYRLVDTTEVSIQGPIVDDNDRKKGTLLLPTSDWDPIKDRPGKYTVCILMEDSNCTVRNDAGDELPSMNRSTALDLYVKYPKDIIIYKFNNVLAVRQDTLDFVAYQWYWNGQIIDAIQNPSAATSIYHSKEIFEKGHKYFVMLTERGKEPVPSCTFSIPYVNDYNKPSTQEEKEEEEEPKTDPQPTDDQPTDDQPTDDQTEDEGQQANKKMINNRLCIEFEGRIYNMYGQRIQ